MFSNDDLPLLAILRGVNEEDIQQLADIFLKTNIRYMEITMNTQGAPELIYKSKRIAGNKLKVGAGTVTNTEELKNALNAGAEFVVTPSVVEEVIKKCVSR